MKPDRKPPEWRKLESLGNHQTVEMARERVLAIARRVLNTGTGIIEAAHELCRLRSDIWAKDDHDFGFFRAVGAETAHLPANIEAGAWDRYRLIAKQQEIQDYEDSVRDRTVQVCRNLIERFQETPPNPS
jgi:hypothetical protein